MKINLSIRRIFTSNEIFDPALLMENFYIMKVIIIENNRNNHLHKYETNAELKMVSPPALL